jgi:hypothetical protein
MTQVKSIVLAAALLLWISSMPAHAQGGMAGAWEITLQTPQGANTVNLTLKQDGDTLVGELKSPMGTVPVSGTATGSDVTMAASIDMQGMSLRVGLKGKLEGEALTGTVSFGDFGEFPFTGKRSTGAASAAEAAALTAPAAVPPVSNTASGKWTITLMIGGAGGFPVTADLKQDGQVVTGTLTSLAGGAAVKGTMTGVALKLEFVADTPQGPLPITMTGELTSAGFSGKASLAGLGEADWTGVRSK